jgi:hypothetical protein
VAAAKRDDQFWGPLARLSERAAKEIDAEKAEREKQSETRSAERRERERNIWERGLAMSAALAPLALQAWRNCDATFRPPNGWPRRPATNPEQATMSLSKAIDDLCFDHSIESVVEASADFAQRAVKDCQPIEREL